MIEFAKDMLDLMNDQLVQMFAQRCLHIYQEIALFKKEDTDPDRGRTFFSETPGQFIDQCLDKTTAQIGNSLLRLVLESIAAWAKWFPTDSHHEASAYLRLYYLLEKEGVNFPAFQYFKADQVQKNQSAIFQPAYQQLENSSVQHSAMQQSALPNQSLVNSMLQDSILRAQGITPSGANPQQVKLDTQKLLQSLQKSRQKLEQTCQSTFSTKPAPMNDLDGIRKQVGPSIKDIDRLINELLEQGDEDMAGDLLGDQEFWTGYLQDLLSLEHQGMQWPEFRVKYIVGQDKEEEHKHQMELVRQQQEAEHRRQEEHRKREESLLQKQQQLHQEEQRRKQEEERAKEELRQKEERIRAQQQQHEDNRRADEERQRQREAQLQQQEQRLREEREKMEEHLRQQEHHKKQREQDEHDQRQHQQRQQERNQQEEQERWKKSQMMELTIQHRQVVNNKFGMKSRGPSMPKRHLGDFQNIPDLIIEPKQVDQSHQLLHDHIDDLRQQIDQRDKMYAQLNKEHSELLAQHRKLQDQLHHAEAIPQRLQLQHEGDIRLLLEHHKNEAMTLQAQTVSLQEAMKLKDQALQEKNQDHYLTRQKCDDAEKRLHDLELEHRRVLDEHNELKRNSERQYTLLSSQDQVKAYQEQLNQHRQTIDQKDRHIETLVLDKQQSAEQMASLQTQLNTHLRQYENLREQHESLAKQHEEKLQQHQLFKAGIESSHSDALERQQRQYEERIQRHEQEKKALREGLDHHRMLVEQHRSELQESKLQIDQLEKELQIHQQRLQSKHREAEMYRTQAASSQEEERVKSLMIELEQHKSNHQDLTEAYQEANAKHQKALSEVAALQKRHMAQKDEFHQSVMDLKRDLLKAQGQLEQLQHELDEKEETIRQLHIEKSEAETQASTLRSLSDSQQQQLLKVMQQLTRTKSESGPDNRHHALMSHINSLQEQLQMERQGRHEDVRQTETQKDQVISQMTNEIGYLRQQLQYTDQQMQDLHQQFVEQVSQVKEMEVQNQYLQDNMQESTHVI